MNSPFLNFTDNNIQKIEVFYNFILQKCKTINIIARCQYCSKHLKSDILYFLFITPEKNIRDL